MINKMIWPSGTGQLPTNVSHSILIKDVVNNLIWLVDNHTLHKADQLRQWVHIQPFVLWLCWWDANGQIPCIKPLIPTNSKSPLTFCQHLDAIYKLSLYLLVVDHILSARSITLAEVKQGMWFITLYNTGAVSMGFPMVTTWHLSRCNRDHNWVNLNGTEIETSLTQAWVQKHHVYELVCNFLYLLL